MMKLAYISFLLCHFLLVNYSHVASVRLRPFKSNISIPALFVFGDSWVDNGNGKYLGNPNPSSAYGVDFKVDNQSRATNGKTMADFIARTFGMPCLPPFLSLKKSESIQFGANYASAGCGILPDIKQYTFVNCMDLDEQIMLFKSSVENSRNSFDLSKSLIFINMGQNDMDLNKKLGYDASPNMGQYLWEPLSKRLQMLYDLGGRKFLVSNVLPLGCRPFSISQEKPITRCVERLNKLASQFNSYLPQMLEDLQSTLPGSNFVLLDVYKVFEDVSSEPSSCGISDISHSCCAIDSVKQIPICKNGDECSNRNQYAFFDGIHPTEVMNSIMISRCLKESTICKPINLMKLMMA
uniref:SGNH hydrolase-type esterase domain-containing protein n=1 Tax=Salix viminalis TaxID=40686 RepID=A0A6N2L972_SALVM